MCLYTGGHETLLKRRGNDGDILKIKKILYENVNNRLIGFIRDGRPPLAEVQQNASLK